MLYKLKTMVTLQSKPIVCSDCNMKKTGQYRLLSFNGIETRTCKKCSIANKMKNLDGALC